MTDYQRKMPLLPHGSHTKGRTGGRLMITLVHASRSRSSSFLWLLEEFGEPYNVQYVSIRRGDGSGALDPSNPHPHGKVPVLIDDTAIIFEQSAIALYLADKYPRAGLGPRLEDPARGSFLTLLAYYSGVVEPAFTSKFMRVTVPRGTAGWVDADEVMDFINPRLEKQPYIVDDTFTTADILYASMFELFMKSPLLEGKRTQQLQDYVARCISRPARARAAQREQPA
jgi:glutathione S-transferase